MAPAEVEDSEADPLLYGDQRVQPNLDGQIAAGTHQVSVFLACPPGSKVAGAGNRQAGSSAQRVPLTGAPLVSMLKGSGEFFPVLSSFSIISAADGHTRCGQP